MKLLITAFEPFNGSKVNPSQQILDGIGSPQGAEIIRQVLPVEFCSGALMMREMIRKHEPDVVLCLGQAGNRPEISVERVAVNIDCVRSSDGTREVPDNAGACPVDVAIEPDGENAYFSTLPVWKMVEAMHTAGVRAAVSYSAGTYVCNHIMYTVLHEATCRYPLMRAGFIHVPFLPEQMAGREHGFDMAPSDMLKGIQAAVNVIAGAE